MPAIMSPTDSHHTFTKCRGTKANMATTCGANHTRCTSPCPENDPRPGRAYDQPADGDGTGHMANARIAQVANVPGGHWLYAETTRQRTGAP